jgi:hypothetical protein
MYDLSQYLLLGLSWVGQVLCKPTCTEPKINVANGFYVGVQPQVQARFLSGNAVCESRLLFLATSLF